MGHHTKKHISDNFNKMNEDTHYALDKTDIATTTHANKTSEINNPTEAPTHIGDDHTTGAPTHHEATVINLDSQPNEDDE
jgi:hypothetical protein